VFCDDEEQRRAALASRAQSQAHLAAPIVTEIEPARRFYEAEDRHQQYLDKHGRATCNAALAGVT
jgi:peptide-methionine (S)-S-oxide reductase